MPTVHLTIFVFITTGPECTPTSNKCVLPVLAAPLQTPQKANPLNWYTTSPLKRHSQFFLLAHTLLESTLALTVLKHIWLHAVE